MERKSVHLKRGGLTEVSKCGGYMERKSVHLKRGGLTEVPLA